MRLSPDLRRWRYPLLLLVLAIGFFVYRLSAQAVPTPICGTTIENPCGEAKATAVILEMTRVVATSQAIPFITATPIPLIGTPVPLDYIPPEEQATFQMDLNDVADDHTLGGSNSVWHAGAVLNPQRTGYGRLFVWSYGNEKSSSIGLDNMSGSPAWAQYDHSWVSPRTVGKIFITKVPSTLTNEPEPIGVIVFRTEAGLTGTLDVKTGDWMFSDMTQPLASTPANPVVPTPMP